jgi:hypothetical protein
MQDFAKNTSVVGRELEQPEDEWSLDPASLLLGVLLGPICSDGIQSRISSKSTPWQNNSADQLSSGSIPQPG